MRPAIYQLPVSPMVEAELPPKPIHRLDAILLLHVLGTHDITFSDAWKVLQDTTGHPSDNVEISR